MKTLFLCLFLALNPSADSLKVLFWNLENYFDWRNDSTSVSDAEFSSQGVRRWTKKRFYAKSNAIAKGILWAGTPDVIGLAEVENAFALKRLLSETALRKLDYRIVHFDSPDPRGIDVALLYRSSRLELADAKPCHLYAADSSVMATRDILLVRFREPDIAFLVNHHPSKYGGAAVSESRRQIAVQRMKQLADSLQGLGVTRIVAMGDMNDTPANPVYRQLEPTLINLAEPLYRQGEGTIKYDGAWELIDMFFASPDAGAGPMQILQIPFLTTRDASHAGTKPLRTYSGPRYLGGVSDHCPVMVHIMLTP
ncbi:MAG: hypothetical protein J6P56_09785 [Bacteroidales bacterium]|nr:hypothetical protein [Bacteroidales bacterium]